MKKDAKIYIAGHNGMVGSALVRELERQDFTNLLVKSRALLDLTSQAQVMDFFAQYQPEYVFLAAAKVGGIAANLEYPADFIRDNLLIQDHIIDAAYRHGVKKLLFLGSSCIYPKYCPQPVKEDYLLTASLEPTNEWYAVAKIAGIKMCQAYRKQHGFDAIALIPTNMYGPCDNFSLTDSHVLPAVLRKMHEAKVKGYKAVDLWGSGEPRREFLHVDDLAVACVFLMQHYSSESLVNVGVGKDISIRELAEKIKAIVGFNGTLNFDHKRPDGTPRKLLDISKINKLGWSAKIPLTEGIQHTYQWYLANAADR